MSVMLAMPPLIEVTKVFSVRMGSKKLRNAWRLQPFR
jgi:hypothetical protein